MKQFWELLKSSTIFQGLITLAVIGTCCYLWVTGQSLPEELSIIAGSVVAFFFGSKMQQQAK